MAEPPDLRAPIAASAVMAAAHAARFASPQHALDDAWISFRIARNLLQHGVLTYDLHQPPVEGMTNLLWTLLSTVWIGLLPQVDPVLPARLLGAALHVATVVLAVRLVGRVLAEQGGAARRGAYATGLLMGISGSMAFWSMSGLETPLWTFLAVAALDRLHARAFGLTGLLLGLLAATRPEGVLAGGLIAVGAVVLDRRRGLSTLGIFAGLIGLLEAWRQLTYGAWVPNTYYAKAPDLLAGLRYVGGFALYGLGVLGPLALVPALRLRGARWLLLLALLLLAGTAWSGGDWMPGFRRCSLALLALAGLAGLGVGLARSSGQRVLVGLGLSAWLLGSAAMVWRGKDSDTFSHQVMADLGRRAAATESIDCVALVDIGRFGWTFQGDIVDLVGLTDAHLGHLPGAHANKPWDEEWFRSRDPDLLIARSETRIADPLMEEPRLGRPEVGMVRSVLTRGGYSLYTVVHPARGQWLLVFARDGLELPEALWGPRWPKDLREMLRERGDR